MSLLLATSGDIASGVVEAEGVDFDGVSDYLSRSTDLVGNVDSKTFTFSAWVYTKNNEAADYLFSNWDGGNGDFYVFITNTGAFSAIGRNTSNTIIFSVTSSILIPLNTWTNILISIDLSSTSLRHLYINDVLDTPTWHTYSNQLIDFTDSSFMVSATGAFTSIFEGRLSDIFLDYTYRDLSIESNRRLFITADGKPTPTATLKALNPILYLPMKDSATAHINEGTGGNFVQNGTLDTASVGATWACKASYFDGIADYLSRTSLTGVADGKQGTISFTYSIRTDTTMDFFSTSLGKVTSRYSFADKSVSFLFKNSVNTTKLSYRLPILYSELKKNFHVSTSFDTSIGAIKVIVDGIDVSASITIVTNTNDTIDFASTEPYYIGNGANGFNAGNIGELYFDTRYTDLATSNPFWDVNTNRPKPVRQVIAETGITPLIAMPLDASNAGKNYGSGGDFTANSAPYVGARGASEFWARSAKFDGSTGYLSRGALTGAVDSKTLTIAGAVYSTNVTAYQRLISLSHFDGTQGAVEVFISGADGKLYITCNNHSKVRIVAIKSTNALTVNTWTEFLFSIDLSTSINYLWTSNAGISNATTATNNFIDLSGTLNRVGVSTATDNFLIGNGALIYLSTSNEAFSQEVNRNKFVDQLGYPKDLKAQIDAGVIPNPLIYMPFDEPANLGKNLGTGGNFTVNGTVTQGADVLA